MNKTSNKNKHPAEKGIETSILGMVSNLLLSIIKGVAGIFGNSYALIADAIESLSDVASSFIVWMGLKIALKEPDIDHPYGHGKAEPIASIIVCLSLFISAIVIVVQSIDQIITPHEIPESFTLIVLVIVIIVKEFLFKKVFSVAKETDSHAVKSDAWHHRSDAITSIGTFIGISIAIWGGPGYESADDWAAILTSGIIIFNAIKIGKPAFSEIMDVAAPVETVKSIRKTASEVSNVKAIDKCLVRKMGFDYYVDIHVVVDGNLSVKEGHEIAHEVKKTLIEFNPRIRDVIVHIEPYDPEFAGKN